MSKPAFTIIYHAGLQGRAEFIRLYLEATATPYVDAAKQVGQECVAPYYGDKWDNFDVNPTPFAPPYLLHKDLVLSQTPNILLYLSGRVGPIDLGDGAKAAKGPATLDDASTFHHQELLLTILDVNNEAHDTHHPTDVALYYEDQKPAALAKAKAFRGRVPTFFSKFESSITKFGSGFLTKEVSYADLALFQLVEGISYAFPKFARKIQPDFPGIWALRDRIAGAPRIASYLKSERREPFNEMGVFRYYPELDEP